MGMLQMQLFGGMPTKSTTLPRVGTVCARCLWLMLSHQRCDNHQLARYSIANASRRITDLRDRYGWAILTGTIQSRRPDDVVVPISEYRIEPEWLNELVGSDPVFAERLAMWGLQQNALEQDKQEGGQ